MSRAKSWTLLCLGLLIVSIGSLFQIVLIRFLEENVKAKYRLKDPLNPTEHSKVATLDLPSNELSNDLTSTKLPYPSFEPVQIKPINEQQYLDEIEHQQELIVSLNERFEKELQDNAEYKLFSEEQLVQKNLQITALQSKIEEHKASLESSTQKINELETKVQDLGYEIKTLIYLQEPVAPSPATKTVSMNAPLNQVATTQTLFESSFFDPQELLRKCVNTSQKFTGASFQNHETSRYREFPSQPYAPDQRRLFENLKNETDAIVIFFSPKEDRLLFANAMTKEILGINPEQFITNFSSIIVASLTDWKKAISQLNISSEARLRLLLKSSQGDEIMMDCFLGLIPSGLFRHHVIGVLFKPSIESTVVPFEQPKERR